MRARSDPRPRAPGRADRERLRAAPHEGAARPPAHLPRRRQADVRHQLRRLVRQNLLSELVHLDLRSPQAEPRAGVLAESQAQPDAGPLPAAALRRAPLPPGPRTPPPPPRAATTGA